MPRKTCRLRPLRARSPCFNEAAARCRGKPPSAILHNPRLGLCFNEAAARCRGKRVTLTPRAEPDSGFNEAAARCRGKPGGTGQPHHSTAALQ